MDIDKMNEIIAKDSLLDHLRRYYGVKSEQYQRRLEQLKKELTSLPNPKTAAELRRMEREGNEEDEKIRQGY